MRNEGIKLQMERYARTHHGNGEPKISTTKGENKGRPATFRVACSVCNAETTNPEKLVYVAISATAKRATCKLGHQIEVGPRSR